MVHARRFVRVLAVTTIMLSTRYALADDGSGIAHNGLRLSLGVGGASRSIGGNADGLFATELTLTFVPWVSLSSGLTAGDGGVDYAYGELAFHFIASVGFGLGYGAYQADGRRPDGFAGHLFVGLPIPLTSSPFELIDGGRHFFYLLPFYRPAWGPWSGTAHELGVMLKFSYGLLGFSGWFGG